MNIEISKERMLEMAMKLASMDFCPEQRVFYKNILRMVKADTEGRLLVLPCKVGDAVYENNGGRCQSDKWISVDDAMPAEKILYLRSSREPIDGIALCGKKLPMK